MPRLYVHVGIGELAKIDFRALYNDVLHGALNRHITQNQGRQSFRREPIHGIHGDTVAVRINKFLVDPIAAALREFLNVELAWGEHHLTHCAVDFIAIDIDIGKVVVGADFLNLAERVLQGAPFPQSDVLQRSLIVGRVGRVYGGLCGKFALREAVQSIGLTRQVNVIGDVGSLANQFIRLHDKAADVPANDLKREITDRGRSNCCHQPARVRHRHDINACNRSTKNECDTDCEHSRKHDVRVRVGDTAKDRMFVEQSLESGDIRAHREGQQKEPKRNGEPAPRPGGVHASSPREHSCAARNENKENGDCTGNHGYCQQPARNDLACGQGE